MDIGNLFKRKQKKIEREASESIGPVDERILCPVCGKEIKGDNLNGVEYVKTKRGTEIFIHNSCVRNWG